MIEITGRLKSLPPYLFAEIENQVAEMKAGGKKVFDLSIGDPDLPTPPEILRVMHEAALKQENQGYSSSRGEGFFRDAVAEWYEKRFGVKVDSGRNICALIGSKEGLANVARALVSDGDRVLVPDPGYPVYANGAALLNGGVPEPIPLTAENGYMPQLEEIDISGAKIMYLNYPNNPTGAVARRDVLKRVVEFATDNNIILCYDNAYSEICFDEEPAPSILEIPGAMDCCVEFNSCSKTFNMTGTRLGFAVGSEEIVSALAKVKSQIDSGPPIYAQRAGAYALSLYRDRSPPGIVRSSIETYRKRMEILVAGLNEIGLKCRASRATFYQWIPVPDSSIKFARKLLSRGIVVTPGIGFGRHGEGFVRFALTRDEEVLHQVVRELHDLPHD